MFANGNGALFANGGISSIDGVMSRNLVRVFLVIGLFKFAKDAPKFIKDAMGIKDSGGGGGFMGKALAGMAGAAAGFAGGVATGGLAGGLSGIMTGASAGFAGKPGQAYSQVRDEQAKLLGKTPGGVKGKLQNKAMQRSVMKHTGLNNKLLKDLKNEKIAADNELENARILYERDPDNSDNRKKYEDASARAAKANSAYSDANSLAKQIGLKKGFMEDNKRHGHVYAAAKRVSDDIFYKAGIDPKAEVKSFIDSNEAIQKYNEWKSASEKTKTDTRHGIGYDKDSDDLDYRHNSRENRNEKRKEFFDSLKK